MNKQDETDLIQEPAAPKNIITSAKDFMNGVLSPLKGKDVGQMVEEFDRFCFEDHAYGDTAIVYGEAEGSYAGYHVMFYVGTDTARNASARDALRNQALESWFTEITDGLEPQLRWAYKLVD